VGGRDIKKRKKGRKLKTEHDKGKKMQRLAEGAHGSEQEN